MANTITSTYSFTLPEVGADTNAWGGHLNANFSTIDAQMLSRAFTSWQTMAGGLNLPANGLNVGSGQLQVTSNNVSMSGSLSALNGTFSGTLGVTGVVSLSNNVNIGGTLGVTGPATFSQNVVASTAPSAGAHLTNKAYVDGQDNLRLPYTGGTLSGYLTLVADPTTPLHAATKQYVDARDSLYVPLSGGTMSGSITIQNAAPGVWLNDTNGSNFGLYNDANICGIWRGGAANWAFYVDTSANMNILGNINAVSAGFSGTLNVSGAATLSNNVGVGGALTVTGYSSLNGGLSSTNATLSGTLGVSGVATLSSNVTVGGALTCNGAGSFAGNVVAATAPSAGSHLTNKSYVDANDATRLPLTGGTLTGNLVLSSTSPTIQLADTDNSGAYLHCNSNIVGFLNNAYSWSFQVDQSGNATATGNVTAYSDARIKENVQTIRDATALVSRMRGVFFDRIDTGEHGVGVIAQEMREVIPQVVHESDGRLSVAYGNLAGVLIEAIKELSGRIEALESK